MNRDMDVVRQIVLALRDATSQLHSLPDVPDEVFKYNAQLLIEEGLALGYSASGGMSGTGIVPAVLFLSRLTWDGHDFADSIADDTIWKRAKEKVIKPSASWTFAILKEYLKAEIKRHLGMSDGS